MIRPIKLLRAMSDSPVLPWQKRALKRATDDAMNHDVLPSFELLGNLPEPDDKPILLSACDEVYYHKYGKVLAETAAMRSPCVSIHLHVYAPSESCRDDISDFSARIPRLTISHETAARDPYDKPSTFYYAATRFAVAARLLNECKRPMLIA